MVLMRLLVRFRLRVRVRVSVRVRVRVEPRRDDAIFAPVALEILSKTLSGTLPLGTESGF